MVGVILIIPFIVLLGTVGQIITAFWVTPEMVRLWSLTNRTTAYVFSSLILILYLVVGAASITFAYFRLIVKQAHPSKKRWGLAVGTLFSLPVLGFYMLTHIKTREREGMLLAILGIWFVYMLWGLTLHFANRYFHALSHTYVHTDVPPNQPDTARRHFLQRVTITGFVGAATLFGFNRWLMRQRQQALQQLVSANTLPPNLIAKIFPMTPGSTFPEMRYGRFQPAQHPFGVCFSGGGFRAYSAGLGQLRALHQLGLLDAIGAMSCISGGALMGMLFNYAPSEIDDATLLGPVIAPEALTLDMLAIIEPQNIAAPLLELTDKNITRLAIELEEIMMLTGQLDPDKIYARVLNQLFLSPFGLDSTNKFFSLDTDTLHDIIQRNPKLTPDDFYITRPNRPYYIAGMTHVFPIGINPIVRHFESTPLYVGTAQLFPSAGVGGIDLGGGYIESFAFDGRQVTLPDAGNLVTVSTPNPPFLLSDMIGSTSAAPGAVLNKMGQADAMPSFYYWPVYHKYQETIANEHSFIDGGVIENLGIVSLLRRQYPVILAFVNSGFPIGLDETDPLLTLDFSVGRLFGFVPPNDAFNRQNTQLFPREQFQVLADGLKRAKQKGELTMFVDKYEIVQPNMFDIPPYPDDGKVTVVWFYNELYQPWLDKLPAETKMVLQDSAYNLAAFPHYKTIFHNKTAVDIPELFYLSPEQINLLSHMWTYAVMDGAGDVLDGLRNQFA